MANKDTPTGMSPHSYLNGSCYNGQTSQYHVPATDATGLFLGDRVKLTGDSTVRGVPVVTKAVPGDTVVGVLTSIVMEDRSDQIYRPGGVARNIMVADDPQIIFEVQADIAIAAAQVGLNANLTAGAGNAITGLSGEELDVGSAAATAGLDVQVLRMADKPDNEFGVNAKMLVKLNNHQFTNAATGV
jgi:hypothetical protein